MKPWEKTSFKQPINHGDNENILSDFIAVLKSVKTSPDASKQNEESFEDNNGRRIYF
jgi:hypothetical protein